MDWEDEVYQKQRQKEIETRVIEQYKQDESVMILIFSQWCINQDLNPVELYEKAYPGQTKNKALESALEQTVTKEESDVIDDAVVLQVLQVFENNDLAFVVQEEIDKRKSSK